MLLLAAAAAAAAVDAVHKRQQCELLRQAPGVCLCVRTSSSSSTTCVHVRTRAPCKLGGCGTPSARARVARNLFGLEAFLLPPLRTVSHHNQLVTAASSPPVRPAKTLTECPAQLSQNRPCIYKRVLRCRWKRTQAKCSALQGVCHCTYACTMGNGAQQHTVITVWTQNGYLRSTVPISVWDHGSTGALCTPGGGQRELNTHRELNTYAHRHTGTHTHTHRHKDTDTQHSTAPHST